MKMNYKMIPALVACFKKSQIVAYCPFKVLCLSFLPGESCTMTEYNKLKSMLLDMQLKGVKRKDKGYGNSMDEKRALVDAMFKYLDLNGDGRLGSEELAQVGTG